MSEDLSKPPNALDHNDFEREDLSPGGVLYFLAGLAIVGVLIYFIVVGLYNFLDRYEREHQAEVSPLQTPVADTRSVGPANAQAFPEPRLEVSERSQLRDFVAKQDQTLATYDWVDKDKGVVRIPIDRAMALIAERGLPVRSEGGGAASATTPKTKAPAPSAAEPGGASQ